MSCHRARARAEKLRAGSVVRFSKRASSRRGSPPLPSRRVSHAASSARAPARSTRRARASARIAAATWSMAIKTRELLGMEVGVAEQFLPYAHAFHEEADVELVGHADAAMHLHRLLHGKPGGGGGPRLGHRDDRS